MSDTNTNKADAVVASFDWQTATYEEIEAARNKVLKARREDFLDKGQYVKYIYTFNSWQRFWVFAGHCDTDQLTDGEYWTTLRDVWINRKTPYDVKDIIRQNKIGLGLFEDDRAGREALMTDEEKEALRNMPDNITICRGHNSVAGKMGLCWTTDKDVAKRFARSEHNLRAGTDGYVTEGKCKKADVLAYFHEGEAEIVINPKNVIVTT
jgi:hypothetical protein